MNSLLFEVPVPPSVNDYLGKKVGYTKGKYGKDVPIVVVYKKQKAVAWSKLAKNRIEVAKVKCNWEKTGEFEYVECVIDAFVPQKKVDCDNLLKCLLDAIKECNTVYDDSMIIPRFDNVFIDSTNPRLQVTLKQIPKKGIFLDDSRYCSFKESNCSKCKNYERYGERCSTIRGLLENRIPQKDVVDIGEMKCQRIK